MKKLIAVSLFILVFFLLKAPAIAQSLLEYPISELGYCRDAKECYLYCEIPRNMPACWSYGQFKFGPQVLGVFVSQEQLNAMKAKASEMGITFPVAELGNCADPIACQAYCDVAANQQACSAFGAKHGVGGGSSTSAASGDTLKWAEAELGCSSVNSCRQYCEDHHDICQAFAKRHGLTKLSEDANSKKQALLKELETALGCTSAEACAKICNENRTRCMDLMKQFGLNTAAQSKEKNSTSPTNFQGYAGCRTADECRALCSQNPSKCPGFPATSPYPTSYPSTDNFSGSPYPTSGTSPLIQPQTTISP